MGAATCAAIAYGQSPAAAVALNGFAPLTMEQTEKGTRTGTGSRPRIFPRVQIDDSAAGSHSRVCIVTPQILGPTRNGGIGTAYTSLALILAQAGNEVTVLLSSDRCVSGTMPEWVRSYASKGVILIPMQRSGPRVQGRSSYAEDSYEVFLWLRDNQSRFDVLHCGEWLGLGYYSLLAKHQGIAFRDLTFCVGTHGSTSFVDAAFGSLELLGLDFMERESVRLADVVVSPSQYLLNWMVADGWKLPESVFVSPNAVPASFLALTSASSPAGANPSRKTIREIVFFGRLEIGKGLILFCDAIDEMLHGNPSIIPRITFLGRSLSIRGEDSGHYVRRRAQPWGVEVTVLSKDHDDALGYISREGVLVVIPSVIDNFPYTVLECIARRVPFLASAAGGIPEQIAECDLDRVCFEPRPEALAAKIERALREAPAPASPAFDFAENNATIVRWHEALASTTKSHRKGSRRPLPEHDVHPLVSVCLVHHDRPDYLKQSIESLRRQDYLHFEVILVDDGSTVPGAIAYLDSLEPEFRERGWQIIRGANRYAGAARNSAARLSRGDYLLFMDDDNYACAEELSVAVAVAQKTDADILTFMPYFWEGDQPPPLKAQPDTIYWLPLGGCVSSGMYQNVFGDTNALIKRSAFEQLGGFRETYGVGGLDWELWARAVLRGFSLELIPLPLFWYRVHFAGISGTTDRVTNALFATKPYRASVSRDLQPALAFAVKRFWLEQEAVSMQGTEVRPALQNEIDALWDSPSWRALRPLRNLVRRIQGRPKEIKPAPRTDDEAVAAVLALLQSRSWELTAPIRLLQHLPGSRRRSSK